MELLLVFIMGAQSGLWIFTQHSLLIFLIGKGYLQEIFSVAGHWMFLYLRLVVRFRSDHNSLVLLQSRRCIVNCNRLVVLINKPWVGRQRLFALDSTRLQRKFINPRLFAIEKDVGQSVGRSIDKFDIYIALASFACHPIDNRRYIVATWQVFLGNFSAAVRKILLLHQGNLFYSF